MARLRVERVWTALDAEERRRLRNEVEAAGRHTLQRLLGVVEEYEQAEKQLDEYKDDVYRAVFDDSYSDDKDYLLRNEYRLLTNKAYDVLAEHAALKAVRAKGVAYDRWLCRSLVDKRLFQEFDRIAEKAHRRAVEGLAFTDASEVSDMQFHAGIMRHEVSIQSMTEARSISIGRLEELRSAYLTESARELARIAGIDHTLAVSGAGLEPFEYSPECSYDNTGLASVEYFRHKAKGMSLDRAVRLEHCGRAIQVIEQLDDSHEWVRREKIVAYGSLGIALFLDMRYGEACDSYTAALELFERYGMPADTIVLYNYLSALVKAERYREGMDLYRRWRDNFESEPRTRFRSLCMASFCHIFSGDAKAALSLIPASISQRPESEYHYFWLAIIIIDVEKGDYDNALREAKNFSQRLTRNKDKILNNADIPMVAALRQYVNGLCEVDAKKRERCFAKSRQSVEECIATGKQYDDFLPLVWLRRQLEKAG